MTVIIVCLLVTLPLILVGAAILVGVIRAPSDRLAEIIKYLTRVSWSISRREHTATVPELDEKHTSHVETARRPALEASSGETPDDEQPESYTQTG